MATCGSAIKLGRASSDHAVTTAVSSTVLSVTAMNLTANRLHRVIQSTGIIPCVLSPQPYATFARLHGVAARRGPRTAGPK